MQRDWIPTWPPRLKGKADTLFKGETLRFL